MAHEHDYNLTVTRVAAHYGLSQRTVRQRLLDGSLAGVRINNAWRCRWPDVWQAERGPIPRGTRAELYKQSLLTKRQTAAKWAVSERTVERWIETGLPTRNVFGSTRIAPVDLCEWMRGRVGAGSGP